ncbi:transcription factor [Purpureocillium lavendulum]|uniref:Transcription factor n=1 Tax=Purpureocillium lavendulum TaxID=1247861 RepID=A0AB34FF79_9HYPO|nr:transcription factor [Purpureocillium lavendulum]
MLDSFTDDDPCDIYDFMAISASGMTVEQELLFLRNLDEFTTEPVAEERHNPDLGHGGNPTSAMFSAEAPITLKAKTDCIERDLQQLHQSLAAFDVTYCEEFDKDTSKEVLAPESIIRFAATYFRLSHHHVPIVHRPSFGSNQTAATLILAVILAGALRSPPRDDALCVRSMARLFEEYIFLRLANIMSVHGASHPDIMSSELLETMQAAVLVYNIQFMDNNATTRRRIRTQRLPTLVATVRQLGLFAIRHSMNMEWGQYVQEQSCIR